MKKELTTVKTYCRETYTLVWACGAEEMTEALLAKLNADLSNNILVSMSLTYNVENFEYTGTIVVDTYKG